MPPRVVMALPHFKTNPKEGARHVNQMILKTLYSKRIVVPIKLYTAANDDAKAFEHLVRSIKHKNALALNIQSTRFKSGRSERDCSIFKLLLLC